MREAPGYTKLITVIDGFSEWTGRLVAFLILPMVAGLTYEVIARYALDAPTDWAYDSTYMLYGTHFMLGAGYTLLKGGHIRTDFFYQHWSPRRQGIVDSVSYFVFFFPGMIFFFWMGWQEAYHSWQIGERAETTAWQPILYPFKTVIPVTAVLLLIQGVSELLKSLHAARTGQFLGSGQPAGHQTT